MSEDTSAVIEGPWRYLLRRQWAEGPLLAWVMLNPSTADATEDDPTIRRVRGFTRDEGYTGFLVVNLWAYRATKPRDLGWLSEAERRGPDADDWIARAFAQSADRIVVAWGASKFATPERVGQVLELARGKVVSCLGTTKAGAPRHPLYVDGMQRFIRYSPGDSR